MPLPSPGQPRRRPGALVASSANLTKREGADSYDGRREMPWQQRALAYIDEVPELSYSSRFYAKMLSRLRIYPATKSGDGQLTRIVNGPPVEVLGRIKDKAGGMGQILSNYGRLMFATGEGTLLALDIGTENEHWMFVWNDEVEIERAGNEIRKITHKPVSTGKGKVYGADQAWAARLWTAHPRRSGEADSPMRSALGIAEELIILDKSVMSTAVSRITQGMLILPIEIAPQPAEPGGDENLENDPYITDFTEHVEGQIEHAGSAAAAGPWMNWAGYEYIDRIRWLQMHDPQTDFMERELRSEAVTRLARGFDFPPEVLKGLGDTNHWAARQILDDMWRSHGAPIAQQFCDDVNDAYLRPTLREERFADWANTVIAYDESEVVVKPDRSDDADSAAKLGYVGGKGYRILKNIPEDYAQTEAEHEEWLAIQLKDPSIMGIEDAAPDPSEGPPPQGSEGDSGRDTRVTASVVARELGAIETALARCRELAGARIRNKAKDGCPECIKSANGHPNGAVASVVGAESLAALSLSTRALVQGGTESLRSVFETWGYAEAQIAAIAEIVESYAANTLFESRQPALPSGFAAHLERAKEVSSV